MRTVVVYESMYGNTRRIAEAIGKGLGGEVTVVPVGEAAAELVATADLVVVGAPTHTHGMSRAATRSSAAEAARKPGASVVLEPGAKGPGVREWLAALRSRRGAKAAVFDTRLAWPVWLSGSAGKGIARELRRGGFDVLVGPESYLVTKENVLRRGEEERAEEWGRRLTAMVMATLSPA